ncbi:MAG: hypothetical protein L6Q35_10840 [Phycisphaerales bacterium]|nr:hypothetical protein [Phycisphaerales bacterium]
MSNSITISTAQRADHLAWLLDVTSIPTAAGREQRVIAWIERWVARRPGMRLTRDGAGNMHISMVDTGADAGTAGGEGKRPVYFTAHLDHPAFVIERVVSPGVVEVSFRGGVMEDYFAGTRVALFNSADTRIGGRIESKVEAPMLTAAGGTRPSPFGHYLVELDAGRDAGTLGVGDVGTWDLPRAEEIGGMVHTPACDDLAALAAALAAYDVLGSEGSASRNDVRLLFTRAEEIGFVGAIAACRERTMPVEARVIALENSRSFADSPIGGGPIVRVGDRVSVFSPTLTDAVAKRAEAVAGGPSTVRAAQKLSELPAWKWQRKLMAGGACEASVFCDAGYEATCVCLPLGNYHNMADLDAVQAGTNTRKATIEREFIARSDYEGMVDLLVACGQSLGAGAGVRAMVEKLWRERSFVL